MDLHYVHLILNHIPVVAIPLCMLFYLYALLLEHGELKRMTLVVLAFFSFLSIPVYFSGEGAVDNLRDWSPAMFEDFVVEHEEAAGYSLYAAIFLGVLAVLTIILDLRNKIKILRFMNPLLLLAAVATTGLMLWTGYLGGKIIRSHLILGGSTVPIEDDGSVNLELEEVEE